MLFQMTDFTVDVNDFHAIAVNLRNAKGTNFPFVTYCLKEPIKLVPTEKIPSFYMVNKYGDVYDTTEFVLVPYLRFWISDPSVLYTPNQRNFDEAGEMPRTDFRNNPFHPYWIGGVGPNGALYPGSSGVDPNPFRSNNLKTLMDIYVSPAMGTSYGIAHGYRNQYTPIQAINPSSIGGDLVPNEGGFGSGMFIPAGAKYLQAKNRGDFTSLVDGHLLMQTRDPSLQYLSPSYRYVLSLSSVSQSATEPYILPPLFTDLFSYGQSNNLSDPSTYLANYNSNACISVLTFGVQPA